MSTWLSLLTQSAEQKTYEITNLLPETEYTVSINGVYDSPVEVWLTTLVMVDDEIIETEVNQNNAVYVGDLENNKLTFTTQELHTALVIRTSGDLELTTIQLEKGNLVTDWTPAPEEQEQRMSIIEQTADGIRLEVSELIGEVNENTAQLQVQAGEISSKVSANGVVSAINQTSETIKIDANKINLTGYVTFTNLSNTTYTKTEVDDQITAIESTLQNYTDEEINAFGGGLGDLAFKDKIGTALLDNTIIDGGYIKTNLISFNNAVGTNVNLTGIITATTGQIGALNISSLGLEYRPNSSNSNNRFYISGNPADTYVMANHNASGVRTFSVTRGGNLYSVNADISGKITATEGEIGGWTISSNRLTSSPNNNNNNMFYIDSNPNATYALQMYSSTGQRTFSITRGGGIYAVNSTVAGYIHAESGIIANWEIIGSLIRYKPNANNINSMFYLSAQVTDPYIMANYNSAGTLVFGVNRGGVLYANGVQLLNGYHNSGSFSTGTFGGTLNSTSGTLAGNLYKADGVYTHIRYLGTDQFTNYGFSYMGGSNESSALTIQLSGTGRSTGGWTQISDIRYKKDFVDVHDEFNNFVYSLPIGTYLMKDSEDGNRHIGINANFVDKMLPKEYTQYIINKDEVTGYYSANYTELVPMLVKVVQSQNTRLIDLEHRLSELERMMK